MALPMVFDVLADEVLQEFRLAGAAGATHVHVTVTKRGIEPNRHPVVRRAQHQIIAFFHAIRIGETHAVTAAIPTLLGLISVRSGNLAIWGEKTERPWWVAPSVSKS